MQVKLSDYAKQGKYVILFFYPLDFTFVCPTGKQPRLPLYASHQLAGCQAKSSWQSSGLHRRHHR